jgi:FKBP-type peptidyl-prolyl cis-trans isomerase
LQTDLGIKYIELKKGSGVYPSPGDFVAIDYNAFLNNGTMFDTTIGKGKKTLSFRFGKKQVIPGIESVLEYMQAGGEVTCTIPPQYAYGAKGVCIENEGCIVPPNETLKYFIRLKSVGAGYN